MDDSSSKHQSSHQQATQQLPCEILEVPRPHEVERSLEIVPYDAPLCVEPLRFVPMDGGSSTKKKRGRQREHSEVVETVQSSALPNGWLERVIKRKKSGRKDKEYIEISTQKVFRSLSSARAHIEKNNGPQDWSINDRNRKYARKSKSKPASDLTNANSANVANDVENAVMVEAAGEGSLCNDGAYFTPHVITVNAGEDVTAGIISFCQQGPRAICILSANGTVANATLRQADSSGGTLTYEGRFEIVNLCGSFTPTEREGTRYRAGGLSVSLSSPKGQVVGGCVAGLLVAAGPIQIIVGSFLPSTQPEHKPKKHKFLPASPIPALPTSSIPALPIPDKDEACNGQQQTTTPTIMPSPFQRDAWPSTHMHTMQDSRKSTTDIDISLPEGMH